MSCGLNALCAESWGQTHLHIDHHLPLHLDCPGSPPSRIQFGFLIVAVKAKRQKNIKLKLRWRQMVLAKLNDAVAYLVYYWSVVQHVKGRYGRYKL